MANKAKYSSSSGLSLFEPLKSMGAAFVADSADSHGDENK